MAQVEGVKNSQLQAVAFHMFSKCGEQTQAFEQCYSSSAKPTSECAEEYKATVACAQNLIAEASEAAKEEFHHYTHCLELIGGKYAYCRPEKAAFEAKFPLE
eukprot:GHUV01001831.1.p1 GENE.GHUV01001831.1~~GHUV01001831.1.p1  ORF type:complete len:102 (+),score=12.90 GHUV01001831.1:185-490(+)